MSSSAVRQLIEERFAVAHGAIPAADYPHFCTIDPTGQAAPAAALGYRMAGDERLFLESYLDDPIEVALANVLDRPVPRERIVEIGAHASNQSRATIALWARTARHLDGVADAAVAVLTKPLRDMFARLDLEIVDIAPADPARLVANGCGWGRYYDQDPRVCVGLIAPALPKLEGFDFGMKGRCL